MNENPSSGDDRDRPHFLEVMAGMVLLRVRLHCFALMDNHYHLLEKCPWESVQEQAVLGGAEFLAGLRKHVMGYGISFSCCAEMCRCWIRSSKCA